MADSELEFSSVNNMYCIVLNGYAVIAQIIGVYQRKHQKCVPTQHFITLDNNKISINKSGTHELDVVRQIASLPSVLSGALTWQGR